MTFEQVLDIGYKAKEKPLLLVVDDESSLQTLIFDTLEDDYRLVSAHNGRQGVDMALNLKPAAILMDMMMPDIGGYEAVRLLGADPRGRDLPIIVMTAQDFDSSTVALIRQEPNVVGFLTKPFKPQALRDTIANTLRR